MAGEVADVPGRRRAAARKLRRDVHDGHEVELHAAEGLGLMEAEKPGLVQQLLGVAGETARVLGRLRALAQHRHDLARPAHRLVVADPREVAAGRLRQGAYRVALVSSGRPWLSSPQPSVPGIDRLWPRNSAITSPASVLTVTS